MRGIANDLRATRTHVERGDVSESYARDQVDRGNAWLKGLGPRISHPGFADEVEAVSFELAELKGAIRDRFPPKVIRLLLVPQRTSKTQAILSRFEAAANVLALQHARNLGVDPGELLQPKKAVLPSVEVLRYDQGWVERRGRARVEVAYELLIGGAHVLFGSKRYVMRQADWALMVDAFGQLPELERLTGLAKRRALHKARKARRLRKAARRAWKLAKRALVNHDRRYLVPATSTTYSFGPDGLVGRRKDILLNPGLPQPEQRREQATGEHQASDLRGFGWGGKRIDDDAGDGDDERGGQRDGHAENLLPPTPQRKGRS